MTINQDQIPPRQILHPVLTLIKKKLGVLVQDLRMFKAEIAARVFPDGYGQLLKRAKGWTILNNQGGLDLLN